MLDTQKLLYILPEVAYIAEGLPGKKPHSFSIHSFTQINGSFLDENSFIAANIQKLFSKLEPSEKYHIILPDFLFTSTIVSIKEKSDTQIKEQLQSNTFPQIGITKDTHLIDSAVLNEIRGTSRVQLSAIEKELLAPLRVAVQDHAVTVAGISSLSWVIKSLISLEPSISVLQMGSHLYVCEHYIGIDQASYAPADDVASIAETIRTLKGSEPSIQTVYLLSNPLVEEKLKEQLNKTLPIQQMAGTADEEERMPASVKEVIEYSFKTLSIPDYPVPIFVLTKPTADEVASFGAAATTAASVGEKEDEEVEETELPKPSTPDKKITDEAEDATPATASILPTATTAAASMAIAPSAAAAIPLPLATNMPNPVDSMTTSTDEDVEYDEISSGDVAKELPEKKKAIEVDDAPVLKPEVVTPSATARPSLETAVVTPKADEDIDLRQFVQAQSVTEPTKVVAESTQVAKPLPTIKNKSGVKNMLRMIFIALAVFAVTVAVGVGGGLAILKFSGSAGSTEETPIVAVETTPTPEATATPEPTPDATESATPANLKILVVNATTKAGYAGTFKTKIEQAKLGTVTATNAKGKYDGGYVTYMKERNDAILTRLDTATDVETTFDEAAKAEDPQGTYDLILVLAE